MTGRPILYKISVVVLNCLYHLWFPVPHWGRSLYSTSLLFQFKPKKNRIYLNNISVLPLSIFDVFSSWEPSEVQWWPRPLSSPPAWLRTERCYVYSIPSLSHAWENVRTALARWRDTESTAPWTLQLFCHVFHLESHVSTFCPVFVHYVNPHACHRHQQVWTIGKQDTQGLHISAILPSTTPTYLALVGLGFFPLRWWRSLGLALRHGPQPSPWTPPWRVQHQGAKRQVNLY